MKNRTHVISSLPGTPCSPRVQSRLLLLIAAMLLLLLSTATNTLAGSATWKTSPATGDWNTSSNWTAGGPPNGAADTATFDFSNRTGISLSANTEVNGITFSAGANAFTITASPTFQLTISGVGITNNSGVAQNFVAAVNAAGNRGLIELTGASTAGNGTFTNKGSLARHAIGGITLFTGNSTAGNGTFVNKGGAARYANGGETFFADTASAGNGSFINNGAASGFALGGFTYFSGNSTAGNGTFTTFDTPAQHAGGGRVTFIDNATAGNGTFTNNTLEARYAGGGIRFLATSTGGNGTFTTTRGPIQFWDSSTAGNGTFTTSGGGFVDFSFYATAGNGTFTNNTFGSTRFSGHSNAGNGTFVNNSGGSTSFKGKSTASHAILIANDGGVISFSGNDSKGGGGTAQVKVFDNGGLFINKTDSLGTTIGSIEGNGRVVWGNNLTVGGNDMSTTFSGVMSGDSLTKTGKGKLNLTNANNYTGGTTINLGKLLVNNTSGSGTGSGPVQVNAGKLGGTGIIAGAVTVGTGSGSKAFLSPGNGNQPNTFTIQGTLTFNSDATYKFDLNSSTATADKVVANGVTINSAQFSFADLGSATLSTGTVFTVISNTAATAIAGTFSNLADGATFTNNGNRYKVNYQGGDGNDLTLKVVP